MARLFCVAVAVVALLAVVPAQATVYSYSAELTGFSEAPPNTSPGMGMTLVDYDDTLHTLHLHVEFSGLVGNTTASHIHSATAIPNTGTAGVATTLPTFAGFPLGVTAGTYDNTLDLTQTSSWNQNFINNNGGTTASAEAALAAGIAQGRAYLNIHTNEFPGGEIRGFLHPVPEPGTLALVAVAGLFLRRRS